jgi:hypothetical protein
MQVAGMGYRTLGATCCGTCRSEQTHKGHKATRVMGIVRDTQRGFLHKPVPTRKDQLLRLSTTHADGWHGTAGHWVNSGLCMLLHHLQCVRCAPSLRLDRLRAKRRFLHKPVLTRKDQLLKLSTTHADGWHGAAGHRAQPAEEPAGAKHGHRATRVCGISGRNTKGASPQVRAHAQFGRYPLLGKSSGRDTRHGCAALQLMCRHAHREVHVSTSLAFIESLVM